MTSKHQSMLPRVVGGHGAVPGGNLVEYERGVQDEPVGIDELNLLMLGGASTRRPIANAFGGPMQFHEVADKLRKPLFTVDLAAGIVRPTKSSYCPAYSFPDDERFIDSDQEQIDDY